MAVHRHSQSPPKSQPHASKIHLKEESSDKVKFTKTAATEFKSFNTINKKVRYYA
jgi:hypothetical protein